MLFNSARFILFFICIYFLYWKVFKKHRLWLLVISGCIFYGSWDWRFLILLFFTSGVDFYAAKRIQQSFKQRQAKTWLLLSICSNLVTLGFFKYFNFFVTSLDALSQKVGWHFNHLTLNVILPVGISFYTFQSIAFVTDVYRGKTKALPSALQYFAFICFFPQMVAGPIERANHMLPQFLKIKKWNRLFFESGINLLVYGFFKKVVIADNLAIVSDHMHQNISSQSSINLFIGVSVFAIQIYADFSGYTDIARGASRLLGYKLNRNFYFPYFSTSFRMFWKRWHISLSTWFRDYVYIPLGGKYVSPLKRSINLLVTFIISGLWHGANFTFLVWGFFHGLVLILEKMVKNKSIPKQLSGTIVFFVVAYLFTLFRSPDLTHFINYSIRMFSFTGKVDINFINLIESKCFFILPLSVFVLVEIKNYNKASLNQKQNMYLLNILFFVFILLFSVFENAPTFIYFQF